MRSPVEVSRRFVLTCAFLCASLPAVAAAEADVPAFLPTIEIGTSALEDHEELNEPLQLAGDDGGRWIASWLDRVLVDEQDVLGTEFATSPTDGRQWLPPGPLHGTGYPAALSTSLAGDGSGTTIAAWARTSRAGILLRRSTDGGHTWSDDGVLYDSPLRLDYEEGSFWGSIEIRDVLVAAGGDGNWVAVWSENVTAYESCDPPSDDCPDYESRQILCAIRSASSSDGGVTWSAATTIENDRCYDTGVRLAGDGKGDWLVAWPHEDWYEPYDGVRGAWSSDGGQTWALPQTLLPGIVPGSNLSIAANSQGRWLLAFSQRLVDPLLSWPESLYERVFVSHTDDPSAAWSAPAGVAPWHEPSGGFDRQPSLAAREDGRFALAWSSDSSGSAPDADIVMAVSDDGGSSWGTPRLVDPNAAADDRDDIRPRLVSVGAAWAVAWLVPGDPKSIHFARTRGDCGNGELDGIESCDDGNAVEGDGCDSSCAPTGCGSIVVTAGEDCDDGNTSDTDGCVSCHFAACGDGFVHDAVEECDDANSVDTDACRNACTEARCGDGVERTGIEQCDDGIETGNNDACLDECAFAECGDGYLELGEEECDDGNLAGGDGCTAACMLEGNCGLLNREGLRVKASDASKVLRRAVGIALVCPLRDCDVNGDGKIAVLDALSTLRSAVGLLADGCSWPTKLVVRMTTDEKLGAIQVKVRYADAAGYVLTKSNGKPACTNLIPSATMGINGNVAGEIVFGAISFSGIQGPLDLLRCDYDPVSGPSLHDFTILLQDASNLQNQPVEPPPVVTITAE